MGITTHEVAEEFVGLLTRNGAALTEYDGLSNTVPRALRAACPAGRVDGGSRGASGHRTLFWTAILKLRTSG